MSEPGFGRTVALVAIIAAAAAALVTAIWELSADRISENERARLLGSLSSVIDPTLLDMDLDPVPISALDPELLGSADPVDVFVALDETSPVAFVFATVAPNGYNAPIRLLIGISPDSGAITGVRVVAHRETPGLGDQIELRKSDWIRQFDGRRLADQPDASWAVAVEGGAFDSITGATVTPRAVIEAVQSTLIYFRNHRDELTARAVAIARAGAGAGV